MAKKEIMQKIMNQIADTYGEYLGSPEATLNAINDKNSFIFITSQNAEIIGDRYNGNNYYVIVMPSENSYDDTTISSMETNTNFNIELAKKAHVTTTFLVNKTNLQSGGKRTKRRGTNRKRRPRKSRKH
jgi:hypothetical protein